MLLILILQIGTKLLTNLMFLFFLSEIFQGELCRKMGLICLYRQNYQIYICHFENWKKVFYIMMLHKLLKNGYIYSSVWLFVCGFIQRQTDAKREGLTWVLEFHREVLYLYIHLSIFCNWTRFQVFFIILFIDTCHIIIIDFSQSSLWQANFFYR